ncbi:MAG: tail fiber domain-containing protein [Bacteroidales bacterium]|nr:tail fiber domain-containing protein [Bacteroidales bacterium]
MKTIRIIIVSLIFAVDVFNLSAQIRVANNGNVSIGHTNTHPSANLYVRKNGLTEAWIYSYTQSEPARLWTITQQYAYGIGAEGLTGYIYRNLNNPVKIMSFNTEGRIGINTTSPNSRLHTNSASGEDGLRVQISGASKLTVASNGGVTIGCYRDNPPVNGLWVYGQIYTQNGTLVISDSRYKSDIKSLNNSLERVLKLEAVSYSLKNNLYVDKPDSFNLGSISDENYCSVPSQKRKIGFVAQAVENIVPEVVETLDDGTKAIAYSNMVALLVEAIKEQQVQLEMMNQELSTLRLQLNEFTQNDLNDFGNYPNPVVNETQISLTVPTETIAAKLIIINSNGKLVKEIQIVDRGNSVIKFDANDLISGTYTYSLVADGEILETKKMIVTR